MAIINGAAGSDTADADTINGLAGNDILHGGDGGDMVIQLTNTASFTATDYIF